MTDLVMCPECGEAVHMADASAHWAGHQVVAESVVVPDVVGEVVAWRAWCVIPAKSPGGVQLRSVTNGALWPWDDWMHAECKGGHAHAKEGGIPGAKCTCGLYAAKTREQLVGLGYGVYSNQNNVVIGEVAFAGKVIPGSQGWRAARGRIKSILVPHEHWRQVDALERTYNVPVSLDVTLVLEGA